MSKLLISSQRNFKRKYHKPTVWAKCSGCAGENDSEVCNMVMDCGDKNFILVEVYSDVDKVKMKGHLVAKMVSEIRGTCTANTTEQLQSLRQEISNVVHKYIEPC